MLSDLEKNEETRKSFKTKTNIFIPLNLQIWKKVIIMKNGFNRIGC